MLAYPTPLPGAADALQRRQLDSIISSVLNGGTGGTTADTGAGTTANGGGSAGDTTAATGGTTTAPAGNGGGGGGGSGTTSNAAGGGTTTQAGATPTSTRAGTTTLNNGATAIVSTAAGVTAAPGDSVVTQVSTVAGGQTVVIIRTTAGSSTATSGASTGSSSSSSNGGLIGGVVGGVVGGLALLTAIILLFIVWRRRQSRTGHGYFLCFGQRPKRGNKDFDVDWPTFDPTVGAAGVGGTMGSRSGRGAGAYDGHGGTLPDLDENDAYAQNDMQEIGSGGHDAYGAYYGAAGAGAAAGAIGAHSNPYKNPSEEGHMRNGGWAPSTAGATTANGDLQSPVDDVAPTYDHLDPPEVREARAREQAEAHAQAMSAYSNSNTSPPVYQSSAGHYAMGSSSPPPRSINQRPLSDHRLSTGTTHALASNNYFADEADPESGTFQQGQHQALHLHNPDA